MGVAGAMFRTSLSDAGRRKCPAFNMVTCSFAGELVVDLHQVGMFSLVSPLELRLDLNFEFGINKS